MPFKTCACHVFAIDGYEDDIKMATSNTAYANFSPVSTRPRRPPNWDASVQLTSIISAVRGRTKPAISTTKIFIYGGFRASQLQPEHMWVEYDGKIYDTMPDYELQATAASTTTRACPYLEKEPFNRSGDKIGIVEAFATESQVANMKGAQLHRSANIGDPSDSGDEKDPKE